MKKRVKKKTRDYKYTKVIHQREAIKELQEEVNRLKEYADGQDDLVVKLLAELISMKHTKVYELLPPNMKGTN